MEITVKPDKLRRDKTPTPALEKRDTRDYLWVCTTCRRAIRLPYNAAKPLPCCIGGPKPHVPTLLICEDYTIYQECFYRFMAKGAKFGRPIIYPRNYFMFPILSQTEAMRDLGAMHERDKA